MRGARIVDHAISARSAACKGRRRISAHSKDNLSAPEAEALEGEWISQETQTLANLAGYASLPAEAGLVGPLMVEERQEQGMRGEIVILDRLVHCLIKSQRVLEAAQPATEYFARYRADLSLVVAEQIRRRIDEATAKARSGAAAKRISVK
jgi:hypothetical protein